MEIEIVKPPKNGRLVVPCREYGFTTYKPKYLAKHNKAVTAKRMLLDLVKDHLIPCIVRENTTKDMYDALEKLFQSVNISKNMLLKNKLTSSHTSKTLASNLIKKEKMKDHIAIVGNTVEDNELVWVSMNGLVHWSTTLSK